MSDAANSIALGSKALDGLQMRMAALAANMANASSPQYQEVAVNFERALRDAAAKGAMAVDALRFSYQAGHVFAPGEDRRMDLIIADAAQTATRYSALVDMLGRRMALASVAIGGQG